MKIYAKLFLIVLLYPLVACTQPQTASTPIQTPQTISVNDQHDSMDDRYKASKNALKIHIKVQHVSMSQSPEEPHTIQMDISFKNTSHRPIVFREPKSIGFDTYDGKRLYDLTFILKDADMNVISPYEQNPNLLENNYTKDDFLVIDPGNIHTISVNLPLPTKYMDGHRDLLQEGIYKVTAMYWNYEIGYEIPLKITPTPPIEDVDKYLDWFATNQMIVDLNAWVGMIESQEVEFTLDKPSESS